MIQTTEEVPLIQVPGEVRQQPFTPILHQRSLLGVSHLSTDFIGQEGEVFHALEDVSFDIYPGQTLGIVGESGCGKSTCLMSIMRLLPSSGRITSGEVLYNGIDLFKLTERQMRAYRWKEMAMVFQGAMNALNPVVTIGDQIREPILHHNLMNVDAANKRVDELLDWVGIDPSRRNQYPHEYSGGMRQRAMIAMALACRPKILFADEPTTALDVMIQAQILDLLKRIQNDLGLGLVLVTHDLGVVAETCDAVVVMYGGKVAEYGTVDQVYNNPQHPYTQRLLEAFPNLQQRERRLACIPGTPPRLNELPLGCRFGPRCHMRVALCDSESPNLVNLYNGEERQAGMPMEQPEHFAACHLCIAH
jgi:peptide/nickel transport system ATP-binding protein